MKRYLLLFLLFVAVFTLRAEEDAHEHDAHEFGLSIAGVYHTHHREWSPTVHLHYFRQLGDHSRWALGVGVEQLLGEEKHTGINVGARFEPIERMHLTLMPGVVFAEKRLFSLHGEVVYELLRFGGFHLGPAFEYGWTTDHSHVGLSLHMAYAF